jgi:hypothetical protein
VRFDLTERRFAMNRNLNIAIIMVSVFILFTGQALALTPVSPEKLKATTGQAGITFEAEDILGVDWTADKVVFGDSDGTDGTPALLSLNDIEYAGRIHLNNPVSAFPSAEIDPYTGTMKTGINLNMDRAVVEIDRYHVDSITIEEVPGSGKKFMNAGKSFGSITVEGFKAEITGSIRITSN